MNLEKMLVVAVLGSTLLSGCKMCKDEECKGTYCGMTGEYYPAARDEEDHCECYCKRSGWYKGQR